jgi:hypothetical protein
MKTFETILKDKQRMRRESFKLKKQLDQLEVPEVPDKLKELVGEFTGGSKKRGNANKKPFKYAKQLKEKDRLDAERAAVVQEKVEKEQRKKENTKKRLTTARLLSVRNQKGQPKLKNAMKVLYSKLGVTSLN